MCVAFLASKDKLVSALNKVSDIAESSAESFIFSQLKDNFASTIVPSIKEGFNKAVEVSSQLKDNFASTIVPSIKEGFNKAAYYSNHAKDSFASTIVPSIKEGFNKAAYYSNHAKDSFASTVIPLIDNALNTTSFLCTPLVDETVNGTFFKMKDGFCTFVLPKIADKDFLRKAAIQVSVFALSHAVPPLIGFRLAGVGAGTIAASWQSLIGNVPAHSLFSNLMSLGARGKLSLIAGSAGSIIYNAYNQTYYTIIGKIQNYYS